MKPEDAGRYVVRAAIILAVAIMFLALAIAARGAEKLADKVLAGGKLPTTHDAVGWALGDIAIVAEPDRPFMRYVWIPPWADERWIPAMNFAVNTAASHAHTLQLANVTANGWLMRYDLRRLAPKPEQLVKLLSVWDGLAIDDPFFHVPAVNSKVAAAIIAPHLQQEQAVALAGLSLSGGGIYRADWLLVKMLTTLDGGRYYDFQQIVRKPEKGTAQDVWLSSLGIFEFATQQIQGDQRSAIFRSQVTGKPRRIDVLYGIGRGGNLGTITHDIGDEDIQAGQHPLRNLLKFEDRAREAIVERPNGTHAFALFDNKGNFQDFVPDNIARDHTIPAPHTGRLQPAIGCIRCHGPHDGWQPFGNDVQTILASRLDVFSDLDDLKLTREQAVDRLAGLYAGQLDAPDGPLGRGRRDYLSTAFKITGGQLVLKEKQSVAAALTDVVSSIHNGYVYDLITPEVAARELGGASEPGKGTEVLQKLLGDFQTGDPVDPIIGSLLAGVGVNRRDWEGVYVDAEILSRRAKP